MLHNTEAVTLPSFKEIYDGLEECVKQGVTNHIGLSSYEVSPILEVRAKYGLMTQYQIQENILSRSNLNNLDLIYLSRNSTSIYVRSIFLQGVLLCSLANLPEFFLPEYSVFEKFEKYSEVTGISKFRLCINYAKSLAWSSGIVAGVSSLTEYETLVSEIYSPTCKTQIPNFVLNSFYSDPRNWNKN
jgi:aryl-alcohol dehydrogenase-like predicted oxidoreductase